MKIQNTLVYSIRGRSQRYFAHVTTVSLSWRVQNIVVIGRVYSKLEHSEFSSNFEFDRNMLSGTGARTIISCNSSFGSDSSFNSRSGWCRTGYHTEIHRKQKSRNLAKYRLFVTCLSTAQSIQNDLLCYGLLRFFRCELSIGFSGHAQYEIFVRNASYTQISRRHNLFRRFKMLHRSR